MNILKQIQQGDVWIEKVDNLVGHQIQVETFNYGFKSTNTVTLDSVGWANIASQFQSKSAEKAHTIALGEATGHHHQLVAEKEVIKVDMDKGIFELMEKAILTHEEHKPIELEAGLYRFGIINEYDYESKQNRRVWD